MTLGLLALLVPLAAAQPPARPPMSAGPSCAPLLAARVLAPAGVRVTAYPGTPLARTFDAPATLALRPGYVYRLELTNVPENPGRSLFPEIEVRGTLVPRGKLKYMDYPIPLLFTAADLKRMLGGSAVTKAIYLEDPEKAVPASARPNAPIEIPADTEADAVTAAVENGRLVAILRLGDRLLSTDELRAQTVAGTILLPGERYLASPTVPPTLPWFACPLFDPIMGPKPAAEECILDGGDRGDRLGIGPNGLLGGLNPTDVGVEFTVGDKRQVTSSNVVCICTPRFVLQRVEQTPIGIRQALGPSWHTQVQQQEVFRLREAAMVEAAREKPTELDARIRPSAFVTRQGLVFLVGTTRPNIIAQVEGVRVKGVYVEPEVLTVYPGICPLTVAKSVDPAEPAREGDDVTVTIRYVNTGNKPVSDIVVNDSLSGRLKYVAGSALSDRAANFATSENEAGSVVVRWELPGKLMPGQSGVVKFKATVR